jgi:hypothetical protein
MLLLWHRPLLLWSLISSSRRSDVPVGTHGAPAKRSLSGLPVSRGRWGGRTIERCIGNGAAAEFGKKLRALCARGLII